jgi:transcriptional regulator with XRE-family HTH domain
MEAAFTIRRARTMAGLTLRQLADRANTSHPTLSAYEQGRTTPRVDTLNRILRAAGFETDLVLSPRADEVGQRVSKGEELAALLDLAEQFPARHASKIEYPPFARTAAPPR